MPRTDPFKGFMTAYEEDMVDRNLDPSTIRRYLRLCERGYLALKSKGLTTHPLQIGREEILFLKTGEFNNSQWQLSRFGHFLDRICGNDIYRKMRIVWPQDRRILKNWLDEREMKILAALADPGLERAVVHFEMELGMRMIGVRRLRLQDIKRDTIDVLGKGRAGGKWRTIPKLPDTDSILNDWLRERAKIVGVERVPWVFVCRYGKRARRYSSSGMDLILQRMAARCGFHFSHHTLRRSFARSLRRTGADIPVIAQLLGHEDLRTTTRYLGVGMDDMREALLRLAKRSIECSVPDLSQ